MIYYSWLFFCEMCDSSGDWLNSCTLVTIPVYLQVWVKKNHYIIHTILRNMETRIPSGKLQGQPLRILLENPIYRSHRLWIQDTWTKSHADFLKVLNQELDRFENKRSAKKKAATGANKGPTLLCPRYCWMVFELAALTCICPVANPAIYAQEGLIATEWWVIQFEQTRSSLKVFNFCAYPGAKEAITGRVSHWRAR